MTGGSQMVGLTSVKRECGGLVLEERQAREARKASLATGGGGDGHGVTATRGGGQHRV